MEVNGNILVVVVCKITFVKLKKWRFFPERMSQVLKIIQSSHRTLLMTCLINRRVLELYFVPEDKHTMHVPCPPVCVSYRHRMDRV